MPRTTPSAISIAKPTASAASAAVAVRTPDQFGRATGGTRSGSNGALRSNIGGKVALVAIDVSRRWRRLQHVDEELHQLSIEGSSALATEHVDRVVMREGGTVRPSRRERVVHVRDGDD